MMETLYIDELECKTGYMDVEFKIGNIIRIEPINQEYRIVGIDNLANLIWLEEESKMEPDIYISPDEIIGFLGIESEE